LRLLLVEDNTDLSTWLSTALTQSGYAVDCVGDGIAADTILATNEYDVIVLDRLLPRMDGMTILKRLRQRRSNTPVLMLTALAAMHERVVGMNEGADDYLAKPFALLELEARLRALVRRSQGRHRARIACGPLIYDDVSRSFELGDQRLNFTPREHALLETLIQRAGKPVGKEVLFEHVFNQESNTNLEAIEIYVHRLRKKLEGSGVRVVTLRGLGYLLEPFNALDG
jgi:two-component system, OmpR family, response regulator TctD